MGKEHVAGNAGDQQAALEGSVFTAGAVVQWLRDEMRLIKDAADNATCARQVEDTHGAYFVPAFTGLAVGFWRDQAELLGLSKAGKRFTPAMSAARRRHLCEEWGMAVNRTLTPTQ